MKNILFTLLFLIGMIGFSTGASADPVDLTADTEIVAETKATVDVYTVHYSFKSVDLEDVGPAIINEPFRMPEPYWDIAEKAKENPVEKLYGYTDQDNPYI